MTTITLEVSDRAAFLLDSAGAEDRARVYETVEGMALRLAPDRKENKRKLLEYLSSGTMSDEDADALMQELADES